MQRVMPGLQKLLQPPSLPIEFAALTMVSSSRGSEGTRKQTHRLCNRGPEQTFHAVSRPVPVPDPAM